MPHHPQYNSILDEIQDMIEDSISHAGSDGMASDERALELIKELQLAPPKPPTCKSCKKLNTCKISNSVFPMYNAGEFGCNKHSDYEEIE